ncbi:SDR family oxidoreductase [Aeoliella mucimassa]|uniref:3-oxoacyl-[acyl-carrier-protein] reductase FabG n=1 Tax=Aeoliella mucimassa TaxID=2527972 RepID=A0A518AH41_9BACT|nr:SDR family oxidoreductase [Aeoliella mucimassa]QDU54050.1 3-oxoacyl-[acyl-carrier-protein] reductase FabG [Aeoliella mucimassa]
MPNETDQPVAIVTGSSRGIGAAIAKRLARDGMQLVVNYAGRHDAAEAVVGEITTAGGLAMAVQADVSDPQQVAKLFDQAIERFGGVDVLVNNAGVLQPGFVDLADTDDALFDHLVAVNLKGTFNTLREAAGKLRDGGKIVNLSTSVVGLKLQGYSIYAATKAAVETMTAIFAKELRGRNISVNAVAPGPTSTDLFLENKTPEQIEHFRKMPPLERLGTPDDIANIVAFLASSEASWANGQTLRANGGLV